MRIVNIILILIVAVSISSCGGSSDTKPATTTPAVAAASGTPLPSSGGILKEMVERIAADCISVDITFNERAVSMNQSSREGILADLNYISQRSLSEIPTECSPMMRKIYWSESEIIVEADVYITDGCQFVVFIKDEKPLYANYFTAAGVQFYNNMIQKVATARKYE